MTNKQLVVHYAVATTLHDHFNDVRPIAIFQAEAHLHAYRSHSRT